MIDLAPLFGSPDDQCNQNGLVDNAVAFRIFPKAGTERWMLEATQRQPWHLKTWPRVNWRARAIYHIAFILGAAGLHLPSRVEKFPVAIDSVYSILSCKFDHIGIFLGTPGPNRKLVIYAQRAERSIFVKIPSGSDSSLQIEREWAALNLLSADPDIKPLLPVHFDIAGYLALENINTPNVRYGELSVREVSRVCKLLARRSFSTKPLVEQRVKWEASNTGMQAEHDKATKISIANTRDSAKCYLDSLPQDEPVDSYDAHGDFTRWNVLKANDGSARIIDWEMFGSKPLWFDLIHYYVSQYILVDNLPAEHILTNLDHIEDKLKFGHNWQRSVGYYFAVQALLYCGIYECQDNLHPQARTQLLVWRKILDMLKKISTNKV